MAVFYSGVFNPNVYFTDGGAPPVDEVVKTGTGGIDPGDALKRRSIFKPTGLLHVPRKEGRKDVEDRIEDSRGIEADVAAQLAREFGEETEAFEIGQRAIEEMTQVEIDREIGVLLRKKLKQEEEEMIAMLMMIAAVV